jgi:glycosyltransferase involved in cell wall biosynthesis
VKIAIVHDWLTGMRGGEKVLEVFCELWPDADLFTLLHIKGALSEPIERLDIRTSFVQKIPGAKTAYRNFLPLFPFAITRFDLSDYDLVVSTSHCVAKGVKTKDSTLHISYIHTPMRYVWEMFDQYFGPGKMSPIKRLAANIVRPFLQRWDVATASRVDLFIANSQTVRGRIERHYNRDAAVIHPPVSADAFSIADTVGDYYLIVSAFAPYKRIDLAIEAFARLELPLKIVGAGQDEKKLLANKPPNVEFLGRKSDRELADLYGGCKAFIFPGEEDFGITPLEAQASGRPVIAFGKGGALETVNGAWPDGRRPDGVCSGVFFEHQTVDSLCEAVTFFENKNPVAAPADIRARILSFDRPVFAEKMKTFVENAYAKFRSEIR